MKFVDGTISQTQSKKQSVVLLTSHLGVPQLLRWYLRSQIFEVLHLYKLRNAERAQSLSGKIYLWTKRRHNNEEENLIGEEELSTQSLKRAYDHLLKKGLVSIAGDAYNGKRRLQATVFSRKCPFAIGGLTLAAMTQSVVIPCFSDIDPDGTIRIHLTEPIECPLNLPRDQQLESMLQEYTCRIEEYLLQYPTHTPKFVKGMFAALEQYASDPEVVQPLRPAA